MSQSNLEVEIFSLEDSLVQSDSIGSLDVSVYWLPVLPPPGDVGLGHTLGEGHTPRWCQHVGKVWGPVNTSEHPNLSEVCSLALCLWL